MKISKFNIITCLIIAAAMTFIYYQVSEIMATFIFAFFVVSTNLKIER